MKLKFTRKLNKSEKNRAAQITIPRCIAQAWSEFDAIDLIYDGSCLIVAPSQ
jgi:mannosyltransferase OCH1-like enzyme